MCFLKTKESKLLKAKRDIKVYKIGRYADTNLFKSLYKNFTYHVNLIELEDVNFSEFYVEQGLHSFINLSIRYINVTKELTYKFVDIATTTNYEYVRYADDLFVSPLFIGEFIIPQNSNYMLNDKGEVVSNSIIYTGRHIPIVPNTDLKIKELWKEK